MIWVIGGTSDAIKIVDLLETHNKDVLVSTTTSYGAWLAQKENVEVIQKNLQLNDMLLLIKDKNITAVVDASHPYAREVSENAIEASRLKNIKYLRYERPVNACLGAHYYETYPELSKALKNTTGNILLTIGSQNLDQFSGTGVDRLVARVLPVTKSIAQCEMLGLNAHQVIAIKGRTTKETNIVLMKEYGIKHLVTKDTGDAGGFIEKTVAAAELGIEIHILKRPKITYPSVYNNFNELLININ